MAQCSQPDCENEASVRLYVPWDDDRDVCAAHGRALVQRDGVVAEPLAGESDEWR
ncbi:hypothetical protein SAMN04488063_1882 [Halopelagius inordinatus]|uniref:DUF8014 domain-containing protein n=1 Tax=Halopelagius inordinatus TaxID=553467 RepID=A0A1I2RF46_9EURY|nr:hypothetical protein [Halopelagius inordinatus]SFG38673.1 hypothetical protein SAMN04488063_1882 [Halopelagius inordinatus]